MISFVPPPGTKKDDSPLHGNLGHERGQLFRRLYFALLALPSSTFVNRLFFLFFLFLFFFFLFSFFPSPLLYLSYEYRYDK